MKKISFILMSVFASASFAEIWLPKIFGDNMVLQADAPNAFWGTAAPKAEVAVSIAGKQFKTKANDKGEWSLKTSKLAKNAKPFEITVSENGKAQKTFKNVLAGEVWILGGQSNMQWTLAKSTDFKAALGRINPNIRIFKQNGSAMAKTPQAELPKGAVWAVADEKSIPPVSAIGYYFAEMIADALKTPVGIVDTPLGGSSMIAWVPREKLAIPAYKEKLEKFDKLAEGYDYKTAMEAFNKKVEAIKASAKGKKLDDKQKAKLAALNRTKPNALSPWRPQETPCYLFNAKINPLAGFASRGIVWYQGESDAGAAQAKYFADKFEVLINSWREAWGSPKMPFYFFQLPSFETKSLWADVRVQQRKTAKKLAGVYMVPIVDSGEEHDIHPKDKTFVAKRLFASAMKNTYKKGSFNIDFAEVAGVKISGKKCVLKFTHKIAGKGEPRGFEALCGKKWVAASAKIISPKEVEISAKGDISAVRYLWKSWAMPDAWLFAAQSGWPVSTFDTSDK